MFWISAILVAIFILPPILGIVLSVKSREIANDEKSGVDWWTIGALTDIHNKYEDSKRK